MPPATLPFPILPVQSVSTIHPEETNEEEERQENQLHVSSVLAAPLSPAMPLNATYVASRRSIPTITEIPPSLLALSTLSMNTTTTSTNIPIQSTSSVVQMTNLEPQQSIVAQPPVELTIDRQDQETSMTPEAIEKVHCSIATQTDGDEDYQPTHHHCNDVSVCPCVQIYTRSEQLFMASMAIFFRNSITITPPDLSSTMISSTIKKNNKRQLRTHQNLSSQSTPIINEIEPSTVQNVRHR